MIIDDAIMLTSHFTIVPEESQVMKLPGYSLLSKSTCVGGFSELSGFPVKV